MKNENENLQIFAFNFGVFTLVRTTIKCLRFWEIVIFMAFKLFQIVNVNIYAFTVVFNEMISMSKL